MNIKYIDNEAKFYFICEYCGTPIKDNKGVVDFPLSCSNNIKAPLRFYHRGNCASYGNKQRVKNKWGCRCNRAATQQHRHSQRHTHTYTPSGSKK